MEPQLRSLFAQIKARQISPAEAAAQLQLWQARQPRAEALPTEATPQPPAASLGMANDDLLETVQAVLIQAASGVLKVDAREINVDVKLHEYGFDQVSMTEFFRHVSEVYGMALTPELLREYPTLHGVASYLVAECAEALRAGCRPAANQEAALHDSRRPSSVPASGVSEQYRDQAVDYFRQLLSAVLKIPLHSLEADAAMEQYGINSVLVIELTEQLEIFLVRSQKPCSLNTRASVS